MTTNLKVLSPESSISAAAKIFDENKIHHIPVVEDGKLIGIISKSDYLFFRRGFLDQNIDKSLEDMRLHNYQVKYIMTKGMAKMNPEDRINVALEVFKENLFHAIPIIEEDGTLVGIVTPLDIIKHLANDKTATNEY